MLKHKLSPVQTRADSSQDLGPEVNAVLDRIGIANVRNFAARVVQLKVRLQFTGWLQYVPPALITAALLLIAGLASLLGSTGMAIAFLAAGAFTLTVLIFDLVTVKFRIRPQEPLPHRRDDLDAFDLMRARRSCRSFQTRKLTPADLRELMASVARHSAEPTIGEAQVRFEYIAAPLTVWPVVNAGEFLIAIAPAEYNRKAVIDVGRILQKIVIDATRMGLGTCWIGPGADHASILKRLGDRFDSKKDHIICVCAVGYPSRFIPMFLRIFNRQFRRRLPLSELFFTDPTFETPLDVDAAPFNQFGRCYEVCQWAPSSYNGQTTRAVAVSAKKGAGKPALERVDFYATTASRYYGPVAAGIWCANWELGCEALGIPGRMGVISETPGAVDSHATYAFSWIPYGRAGTQSQRDDRNPDQRHIGTRH